MTISIFLCMGTAPTGSLSVSASPLNAYGTTAGAGTVVTNSISAIPSGGTGAYSYSWAILSGDTITITSPTASNTTFSATLGYGDSKSTMVRCTVTDSIGRTGTVDVAVTMTEISFDF